MSTQIDLVEFEPRVIDLTDDEVDEISTRYPNVFELDWPSRRAGQHCRVTANGWVGLLPLREGVINIQPKVPIRSLFSMWEYVYKLNLIQEHAALQSTGEMAGFFSTLAAVLAQRTMLRTRRGLARNYVGQAEALNTIRGRIDLPDMLRHPSRVSVPCRFDEQTSDIEDNAILAYTLARIQHHPALRPDAQTLVRRAFHGLPAEVALRPITAADCKSRLYTRITADYAQLHALCRFFLSHTGPLHSTGETRMLPFSVNMAQLFEQFVAEWMRRHLPERFDLRAQETVQLSPEAGLSFQIDLVLRERATGAVVCVLDTKYKRPRTASGADVEQIVAYAASQRCARAALIYPSGQTIRQRYTVGDHQVRVCVFNLEADIEVAGRALLDELLGWVR